MHARLRLITLIVIALVSTPILMHAQQSTVPQNAAAAGPRRDLTAAGVRQLTQSEEGASPLQRRRTNSQGKPVALMVVGGAAVLLGAIIGDAAGTLFMIGGAITLLYGLYLYLQ